jgi:hypothetical protein
MACIFGLDFAVFDLPIDRCQLIAGHVFEIKQVECATRLYPANADVVVVVKGHGRLPHVGYRIPSGDTAIARRVDAIVEAILAMVFNVGSSHLSNSIIRAKLH